MSTSASASTGTDLDRPALCPRTLVEASEALVDDEPPRLADRRAGRFLLCSRGRRGEVLPFHLGHPSVGVMPDDALAREIGQPLGEPVEIAWRVQQVSSRMCPQFVPVDALRIAVDPRA